MEKYIPLLEWIGLSKKAAKIYLCLLEYWELNISDIQQYSNIHRVEIYRELPLLLEYGFVIVWVIWKRKLYSPSSPIKIQEKYEEIQQKNKWSIEQLLDKYSHLENKTSISYKKGKKAVNNVFHDIIDSQKKWDVFYRITSETDTQFINDNYLPKNYREKRDKKDLERYVIMSSKSAEQKDQKLERELKIIPEQIDEFDDNVFMSLYANKLAFIDFNTESTITIENKEIVNFQKKLFRLLYKNL